MGNQEMVVALKQGVTFQPAEFRSVIKEVDYSIREMRIKATGEAFTGPENDSVRFSGLQFKVQEQIFPIHLPPIAANDQIAQRVKVMKLVTDLKASVGDGKMKLTIVAKVLVDENAKEGIELEQIVD